MYKPISFLTFNYDILYYLVLFYDIFCDLQILKPYCDCNKIGDDLLVLLFCLKLLRFHEMNVGIELKFS